MIANSKVDEIIVNEMAAKELRIATENYSEAESRNTSYSIHYTKLYDKTEV